MIRFLGEIRVGRITYKNGKKVIPKIKGFTQIMCLTKCTEFGSLSPYELKDKHGRIMENIWQFSKVYEVVPKTIEYYSRYDKTIVWKHKNERHIDKGSNEPNDTYWKWRKKGMKNKYKVRYPVGFRHRSKCLYAIKEGTKNKRKKLGYIDSRKQIYLPIYSKLVKKMDQFKELKERLFDGENLLIIEVDGPHQESLQYYIDKYNVDKDFIEKSTVKIDPLSIDIMLNDPKHPFGHGYCLAVALYDMKQSF